MQLGLWDPTYHVLLCGEEALLELEECPWSYSNSTIIAKTSWPALSRMNHSFLLCFNPGLKLLIL